VSKSCSVMIVLGGQKNLSLVHQTSEGFTVYYSVAVSLELRAHIVALKGFKTTLCFRGQLCKSRKLPLFSFFNYLSHTHPKISHNTTYYSTTYNIRKTIKKSFFCNKIIDRFSPFLRIFNTILKNTPAIFKKTAGINTNL